MWPHSVSDDRPHTVYAHMPTNLSKFTVSVSDFAWRSVDLGGQKNGDSVPMFPKAWQVGGYLAAYAKEYGIESLVRPGCRVTGASKGTFEGNRRWRVRWEQNGNGRDALDASESASEDFHLLIVASGFFSRRFEPDIEGLDDRIKDRVHVVHTAEVKDAGSLLNAIEEKARRAVEGVNKPAGHVSPKTTGTILVVGGSLSGAEAASSLALRLSDEKHSPPPSCKKTSNYAVHHVVSRPFWVLPPIIPLDPVAQVASEATPSYNPSPTFLPLDLCMYDLSRRPPGEVTELPPVMSPERARPMNNYLHSIVGGGHGDLQPDALANRGDVTGMAPWVAVSEGYEGFVRDGAISTRLGRIQRLSLEEPSGTVSATLSGGTTIENVIALVLATGYEPHPSLGFLEPEVLEILGYQPENNFLPLLLEKHNTIHPSLPDLGFIGFYRGPYWGVLEMQARFLGKLWTGEVGNICLSPSPEKSVEIQTMQALRNPEVRGQWPMGDYVGVMEDFARDLGIPRQEINNVPGGEKGGPVVPARYTPDARSPQAQAILSSLSHTLLSATAEPPSFVARAASSALQGSWHLSRTLKSRIPSFPSGTFTGTASFHPRLPTDEGFNAEYLYIEDGELVTDEGLKLRGSRRYVWRYEEAGDKLSVWFVKSNDGMSVDYFFHELEFCGRSVDIDGGDGFEEGRGDGGWMAIGHHLCEKDDYNSKYRFVFTGTALRKFGVRYQVVGPKKDYFTETWYVR
ncbi:MAG: hypothetical protein M1813_008038 [Trichoglossum hirsutum]|jgi:hypothetical protein|nr:MAG: hypothetical protein M1813_008038 [Trichoglossum hirsutum]